MFDGDPTATTTATHAFGDVGHGEEVGALARYLFLNDCEFYNSIHTPFHFCPILLSIVGVKLIFPMERVHVRLNDINFRSVETANMDAKNTKSQKITATKNHQTRIQIKRTYQTFTHVDK